MRDDTAAIWVLHTLPVLQVLFNQVNSARPKLQAHSCCNAQHAHGQRVVTVCSPYSSHSLAAVVCQGLRIDYALVSSSLLDQVVSSEVLLDLPPKWSDHAPLLLELLSLTPPPHNPLTPDTDTGTSTAHREAATSEHRRPGAPDTQHQLQLLHPQAPPESPMWQQLLRRFQDPSQRSIASMFKAAAQRPSSTTRHKVAKTPPMARAGPGNAPQAHSATATIAASPSALPQHEQGLPASEAAGAASNFEAGSSSKQQQKQPTPQAPNGQSAAPLPQQTTRQMQPEHQSCQAGLQQAGSTTSVKPAGSRSGPSSAGGGGGGGQPRGTKRKPQGSSKASASTAAACPKQAKLHTFFSAAAPAGRTSPPPQNP